MICIKRFREGRQKLEFCGMGFTECLLEANANRRHQFGAGPRIVGRVNGVGFGIFSFDDSCAR